MAVQADEHNIIHSTESEMYIGWIIQWLAVKKP